MNRTVKKNQAGFTLIEILIAVIILAILTLPILSAFSSAAKMNHTARVQENCNTVGQLFSERIKAIPLEDIIDPDEHTKEVYGIDSVINQTSADTGMKNYVIQSGALDYNGKPYTSVGDKYYVQVELSPDKYADKPDDKKLGDNEENNINSYNMPSFSDIVCNQNFVIQKEMYQYDGFAKSMLGVSELSGAYRSVNLDITITDLDEDGHLNDQVIDGVTHTMYTEKVTATVTYHMSGDATKVSEPKVFQIGSDEFPLDVDGTDLKNIYLFYTPLDIYRTDQAEDEINITVNTHTLNHKLDDKKLNLYLVEQKTMNFDQTVQVRLQPNRVHVNMDGTIVTPKKGATLGLGSTKLLNIYTNIENLYQEDYNSVSEQKEEKSDIRYLYDMTVKVWAGSDPTSGKSPYLTLSSTKEN